MRIPARPLKPIEVDVLALVSGGYSNPAIGRYLGFSAERAKDIVRGLRRVYGARNRFHLVALAYRHGPLARPEWATEEEREEGSDVSEVTERKRKSVVRVASDLVDAAAPAILSVAYVAQRVGNRLNMTQPTAVRYLREAAKNGELHELKPDRNFFVHLPGADDAGFYFTRLVRSETVEDGQRTCGRQVLAQDSQAEQPTISSYGPGRTTYLTTPAQAGAYIAREVARRKDELEQAEAQRKAQKRAERAEFDRRRPGLRYDVRRLNLILHTGADDNKRGRAELRLHDPLHYKRKEEGEAPLEEFDLHLDVEARNGTVDLLSDILRRGLTSWLADQPVITCRHDGGRILHFHRGQRSFWWHVDSTNGECPSGDTRAEPED